MQRGALPLRRHQTMLMTHLLYIYINITEQKKKTTNKKKRGFFFKKKEKAKSFTASKLAIKRYTMRSPGMQCIAYCKREIYTFFFALMDW